MKTAMVLMILTFVAFAELFRLPPSQRATVAQGCAQVAQTPRKEYWYRDKLAASVHGATEAVCYMGRVDVETKRDVYEVDKLEKHHEALGQAMWYGWAQHKRPVMALIVPAGQWRYFVAVKGFVESNSAVRVIALDEETGNLMANYNGGSNGN